jgi:hypothetical protein
MDTGQKNRTYCPLQVNDAISKFPEEARLERPGMCDPDEAGVVMIGRHGGSNNRCEDLCVEIIRR